MLTSSPIGTLSEPLLELLYMLSPSRSTIGHASASPIGSEPSSRPPLLETELTSSLADSTAARLPLDESFAQVHIDVRTMKLGKNSAHALELFDRSYASSRANFLSAALKAGAVLTALPLSFRLPDGSPASIDIATFGASDARRSIVLLAGTHGVEGFTGAAGQRAVIGSLISSLPSDVNLSIVHCLNPHGMASFRRTNADNVDLNRNFLAPNESFSGTEPAYRAFAPFLNPGKVAPSRLGAQTGLLWHYLTHTYPRFRAGFTELKNGVLTGQYDDPRGLFFGGTKIAEETERFSRWIVETFRNCEHMIGIDVHCGLGRWRSESLFVELPHDSVKLRELEQRLGLPLVGLGPESLTYRPRGAIADAIPRLLPNTEVTWILQEFGTYNPFRVLATLVQNNSLHQLSSVPPVSTKATSAGALPLHHWSHEEMYEVFNPSNSGWRVNAVEKIVRATRQAIRFFSTT